ncbi:hypothetical protein F5Y15DRAFT_275629 [Xylariaceae sp. FL0016]|nr:hypothetical protein F5Y15DRAFT_275629 [Xylariaceae sp. FL0016]
MQSVPSLIGTGTAVAAAASGLVFGQLAEGQIPPPTPKSFQRRPLPEQDYVNSITASRPGTTSSAVSAPFNDETELNAAQNHPPLTNSTNQQRIPRRASHVQITPPKPSSARHSYVRQDDYMPTAPIAEGSRESFSSNGSWMRRLSIRPRSQHGSVISSAGPNSPSIFSFGSGAPILGSVGDAPPQLPPNKLVKRASAANAADPNFLPRRGSRSQMTLRRPATSHQRSATLQHKLNVETLAPLPKFSFDHQNRPRSRTVGYPQPPQAVSETAESLPAWKSFWHSRITRGAPKASTLRSSDGSTQPNAKRICVEQQGQRKVYLVTSNSITTNASLQVPMEAPCVTDNRTELEDSPQTSEKSRTSPEQTPSKQPRRSISMHFSSPTNWISRSGSVRRRKRGDTAAVGNEKRHVSAPLPKDAKSDALANRTGLAVDDKDLDSGHAEPELAAIFRPPEVKRNLSSPLPPLSRLSSFHVDLNRLGSSSPTTATAPRPDEPSSISPGTRVTSNSSNTRTLERASTVGSSEYHRGFTSGDDDDTDFKTDTPFDSFRTAGSGRKGTIDSPLESMFDESPPSTAGASTKPKRLSIQEILGPSFDGGNKIMEEDEGLPTPVRVTYAEMEARMRDAGIEDDVDSVRGPTSPDLILDRGYGRLSLDDDDDLDWSREDESGIYNHLSPPSSMNSRRGSPNHLRTALGHISGNGKPDVRFDTASERPRSTVFDWAEPTIHDKGESDGYSYRPKTVHGKQELDMRGGRSTNRKGPTAAHVRSQSVPIVPDPIETAKSTPKFGTWGLSQKKASEDWDDDFEFEEEGEWESLPGKKDINRLSMLVPASIQATQPTVKAHSGQIRELSLLVNDLKRLRRRGLEMEMLNGSSEKLWREAEGIIALASPDEDDEDNSARDSSDFDSTQVDAKFLDHGFDGASVDALDYHKAAEGQRNAVVRERHSGRRRSVFSPDDDIFGNWDQADEELDSSHRPRTPDNRLGYEYRSSSVAKSVMEAMQLRRRSNMDDEGHADGKLNFDTNSLKELVKRASDLRDGLSDLIRRAENITSSPARTPKYTRADGSPAFTRVFDDPSPSPTRRMPHSRSSNSITVSPSNGLGQRLQMMTVN